MPQKKADKKKYLESRQALWDAIREQRTFTITSVRMETRLGIDTVREYVAGLVAAGYVRVSGADDTQSGTPAKIYELIKDVGVDAPRVRKDGSEITSGKGREQMWTAMQILKDFSIKELAVNATTEECAVAVATAAEYCQFLAKAGYLKKQKNGRYFFLRAMFTGPKAPMIQRVKQVFDPNTGKVMWSSGKGGAK